MEKTRVTLLITEIEKISGVPFSNSYRVKACHDFLKNGPAKPEKPAPRKWDRTGFYATDEWRALRFKVLAANDGRCELCGADKHDGVKLHVDHIEPRSKRPDLELNINNLQILCEDCNLGKSNRDNTDWRKQDAGDWWNHLPTPRGGGE